MQLLPGFRDFYPEDCARRNYILTKWREVARRYGFVEYDGPVLEPMALYEKKSGGELVGQLFDFVDKGKRHVAMRPEMTPTLARMVAARERDFKKPLKWFCVPQFFRYEKQQRGRLREFYQLNCDILGEPSPAADAELVAVLIDTLRGFALTDADFVVRLSSRTAWQQFFASAGGKADDEYEFFQVVDKAERAPPEKTDEALRKFGLTAQAVLDFMHSKSPTAELAPILDDLRARGLGGFVEIDYAIVRGLAYYTGVVFEVFDRSKNERALAGGGRYDKLLSLMSDGKVDLPALGFGMGDVVLANLIADIPAAAAQRDAWLARERACDVFVVIAREERRGDALALVQRLRDSGQRVDFPLTAAKVGKQFQTAEQLGATRAVLVGDEWPQLKVKTLASREEVTVGIEGLADALKPIG
ncbi:MAG: histidyl-tRNA synthetase [Chthoniobacter sp.]|jgi:histidyl-tRNA synthetase|nr:histidyl-tRNA synthetase [Chthoniobacter sp.]